MKDWQIYLISVIVLPIAYSFVYHYDKSGVGSFKTAWDAFLVLSVIGGIILIIYRLSRKKGNWRGWKDGKYDNRYKGNRRRNKSNSKNYVIIIMAVAIVVMGTYAYGNNDISIDEIIPNIPIEDVTKGIPDDILDDITKGLLKNQQSEKESTQHFDTITIKLDKKPSGGATADLTINKLQVVETDYYNIIKMNMKLTVYMELDDMQFFSPTATKVLKNENGKSYVEKCHGAQFDMITLRGDQNPVKYYDVCYHVEKEFKKFNYLGIPITLD